MPKCFGHVDANLKDMLHGQLLNTTHHPKVKSLHVLLNLLRTATNGHLILNLPRFDCLCSIIISLRRPHLIQSPSSPLRKVLSKIKFRPGDVCIDLTPVISTTLTTHHSG